jgi:hypothetical protein
MSDGERLYVDEQCVVSFFIGELGWLCQRWQSYLRYLKHNTYPEHKFVIMMNQTYHPLVHDFVHYTIDLPKEFYDLHLETDGYESPLPGSLPGSLTPPDVYASLIEFIRNFYNKEKAVEIWTPRGCNTWVDHQPHVFVKYRSDQPEVAKPIVVVFPRSRSRAPERNVPEYIWYGVVETLKKYFNVVLAGTPGGASLVNYEDPKVLNLITYDGADKLEKVMHYLTHAALSVSSQSGPTHVSLLCTTPSYIIGHEKIRHAVLDNRFKAPVSFRYVDDYRRIDTKTIIEDIEGFINILINSGVINSGLVRTDITSLNRPSLRNLENKKNLIGVEIGVDEGQNALNILENLDIEKLYLVDPWSLYRDLKSVGLRNTPEECIDAEQKVHALLDERFADKIIYIKDLSENAVDKIPDNLDFVYIDGNHRYQYVKRDIELYYPKVKEGGLVAGHDFDYEQVEGAVKESLAILGYDKVCTMDAHDDVKPCTDWWIIKPTSLDKQVENDIKTMTEIIDEEHKC